MNLKLQAKIHNLKKRIRLAEIKSEEEGYCNHNTSSAIMMMDAQLELLLEEVK